MHTTCVRWYFTWPVARHIAPHRCPKHLQLVFENRHAAVGHDTSLETCLRGAERGRAATDGRDRERKVVQTPECLGEFVVGELQLRQQFLARAIGLHVRRELHSGLEQQRIEEVPNCNTAAHSGMPVANKELKKKKEET